MTAFRATYADMKLIKTRQVVQIIFEVPQKDFDAAYEVLGGLPNPAAERWFGIAALAKPSAHPKQIENKTKHDWRELQPQQQAGMRCSEASFSSFLREEMPDHWHESREDASECVRLICGVESRADLSSNQKARVIWHQLDEQYQAWKALEHA